MGDSLHIRNADPADSVIDTFTSGEPEVDTYFRTRQWFKNGKGPTTYQFLTDVGGNVVGYASVAFRKCDHPHDAAPSKARYLVIYVAGVCEHLHGQKNPRATNENFAESMFRILEGMARADGACVGLSLWVRKDNPRAIAFYRKFGFTDDPGGPVHRDRNGAPHLTMRKIISSTLGGTR